MNKWSDGKSSLTFEYFLTTIKKISEDDFYNLSEEEQEQIIAEYEAMAWK